MKMNKNAILDVYTEDKQEIEYLLDDFVHGIDVTEDEKLALALNEYAICVYDAYSYRIMTLNADDKYQMAEFNSVVSESMTKALKLHNEILAYISLINNK